MRIEQGANGLPFLKEAAMSKFIIARRLGTRLFLTVLLVGGANPPPRF
jgi:hypothetical protein